MKSSGHSLCIIIKFHISTWHDLSITLKGIIGHSLCTCIWSIWYLLICLYFYFYLISFDIFVFVFLFDIQDLLIFHLSAILSAQFGSSQSLCESINILQKIQVLPSQTLWQYHSLIIISISIDFNTNCPVGWISLYSPGMDVIPQICHSVMCFSESLCIIYYQTLGIQLLEYSIPAPPTRASQKPSKCQYLGNQEWYLFRLTAGSSMISLHGASR